MISLKMDKKEAKEATEASPVSSPDLPKYPWWAKLNFDDEWTKKLGLDKYEIGAECVITLRGCISSKEETQTIDTDKDGDADQCRVGFQGEEIDVEPVKDEKEEHYKKLY